MGNLKLVESEKTNNSRDKHTSGMSALIEINRLLRNCASLAEVYDKVIEIVTGLLDAEAAGIILYSEATNELVLQKTAFRISGEDEKKYRFPISSGEGHTIDVFQTGESFITENPHQDAVWLRDYVELFGVRNTAMVPLEVEGRRIGVLHVYNKKAGFFPKEDREVLVFIATHLAILIENAWLYEKTATHQARQEKLLDIHNKLIGKVLNGEGLPSIINALRALLQAHIIVEDNHYYILGSPGTDVDPRHSLKYLTEKKGDIERLLQSGQIARCFPYDYQGITCTRIIAPIGEPNQLMGYLSVMMDPVRAESDLETVAIEQGAAVLAMEMMKERIKSEVENRYSGEFLDDLINGIYGDEESIMLRAEFFGYDLAAPARVAVVSLDNQDKYILVNEIFDRVLCQKVKGDIETLLPNCFVSRIKSNMVILIPQNSGKIITGERAFLEKVRARLSRKHPKLKVSIGVGNICRELQEYQKSYHQALKAVTFTKPGLRTRVMFYEELGIYGLLAEIKDQKALVDFVQSKIGPLLEYDPPKGQVFVETLEVYLECENNLEDTARNLHVHTGTVKYRLRRIREILEIDFTQSQLFNLSMAIQIKRLLSE